MGSSQYGPGGPLQRAQTMDPMGNGPHPPRGGPPPDPGTGYPTGLPERGGAPGGYGGGLPVNMDLASKLQETHNSLSFINRRPRTTTYERTDAKSCY